MIFKKAYLIRLSEQGTAKSKYRDIKKPRYFAIVRFSLLGNEQVIS